MAHTAHKPLALPRTRALFALTALVTSSALVGLSGCGGGGSSTATTDPVASPSPTPSPSPAPSPAPSPTPSPATPTTPTPLAQKAGNLAVALGKSRQLLVGLGTTTVASVQAQGLKINIYDQYLNDVGTGSWPTWNSPTGAYVGVVAANADKLGAVPMFTLYQMATLGDGNISGLASSSYMQGYWDNVRILFQQLKTYNKPALVNFEPDFWGYTQRVSADPTQHFAYVNSVNSDCSNQPNTVAGMAQCLIQMARQGAPKAAVGFPPSGFGDLTSTELAYMQKLGASQADFVVMQTLDRDAGCFEVSYTGNNALCNRAGALPAYWDATNTTTPSFASHFAWAKTFYSGLQLPLLWWQTPLGVPSTAPGGTPGAFRDNRVQYFLTHASELVDAGGVGAVFSAGHATQTTIDTDGGQFKRLSTQYLAAPVALP